MKYTLEEEHPVYFMVPEDMDEDEHHVDFDIFKRYYDLQDDLDKYPNAWLYIVMSKRGPGKTYSSLFKMVNEDIRFAFLKRTKEEVNILVKGAEKAKDLDPSPFFPLNRDFGWNIKPIAAFNGYAGFYDMVESDGEEVPGKFIGYVISASLGSNLKGSDFSVCDYMIWDEFIEQPLDVIKKKLGEGVLNIYDTIKRDRKKRGRPELKFVCLANAVKADCNFLRAVRLVDVVVEMDMKGIEYWYDEKTRVMIHIIDSDFDKEEDYTPDGIELLMAGTPWYESNYGAHFAYNDFTALGREKLNGHKCIMKILYQDREYFLYRKANTYYFCQIRGQTDKIYNLNRENQQKLFYEEYGVDLRQAAIEDRVIFSDYTGYDLIVNYKKNFVL